MAQMIDIIQVEVGPRALTATVRVADGAPLMTSDDLTATTRVYNLMPHIIEHVCLGDAGATFRDVMGNTELAHLLEHMTVELLAQSNVAGDITSGRTRAVGDDGRTFAIELACPDDVLVAGALSSACWMLEWAFAGGVGAEPDVAATVKGLVGLVESLPTPGPATIASRTEGDPDTTARNATPGLRLVDDEVTAVAGRQDAAGVTSQVASVGESDAAGSPPRESPEARQAAGDVALESAAAATTASLSAVNDVAQLASASASASTPTPMPLPADLPVTRSLR